MNDSTPDKATSSGSGEMTRIRPAGIAIGAALLGVLGIATWFFLAQRSFRDRVHEIDAGIASVHALHAAWLSDAGVPAQQVDRDLATRFVAGFKEGATVPARISELSAGKSFSPWYPDARRSESARRTARWEEGARLADKVAKARALTQVIDDEARQDISASGSARAEATSCLAPASDESAFEVELRAMREKTAVLDRRMAKLEKHLRRDPAADDGVEPIREALVRGTSGAVDLERGRARVASSCLHRGLQALQTYKQSTYASVEGTRGLVQQLEALSTNLLPAVSAVYERTRPLVDFIHQAEQPIPGGEVASFFAGAFSRGSAGGPVSALSVAEQLSPETRIAVDLIRAFCAAAETTNRELTTLSQAIASVSPSLREFASSRSRSSLSALAAASPTAATYCEQRTALFDPAIAKLEEARPFIDRLGGIAGQMRPPFGDYLRRMVAASEALLSFAESPLRTGKEVIVQAGASFRRVGQDEAKYMDTLSALRKESSEASGVPGPASATAAAGAEEAGASPSAEKRARQALTEWWIRKNGEPKLLEFRVKTSTPDAVIFSVFDVGGSGGPSEMIGETYRVNVGDGTVTAVGADGKGVPPAAQGTSAEAALNVFYRWGTSETLHPAVDGHTVAIELSDDSVLAVAWDGRRIELYDAPHGMGRNQLRNWTAGQSETFSRNEYSGDEYPFKCQVSARQAPGPDGIAIQISVAPR
mgnify:FL=1